MDEAKSCRKPLNIDYDKLFSSEDGSAHDSLYELVIFRSKAAKGRVNGKRKMHQRLEETNHASDELISENSPAFLRKRSKGNSPACFETERKRPFEETEPPCQRHREDTCAINVRQARQEVQEVECMSDERLDDCIRLKTQNIAILSFRLPDKGGKLKASLKLLEDEKERRRNQISQSESHGHDNPLHSEGPNSAGLSQSRGKGTLATPANRDGLLSFAKFFSRKLDDDQKKESSSPAEIDSTVEKRRTRSATKQTASAETDTVILDDEEESLPANGSSVQTTTTSHSSDCGSSLRDTKIYYPSRDDPDSVYISYYDTACLAPEAFLSSTVMNFYIRYLQQVASAASSCQFFNTYFYKKLKGAFSSRREENGVCFSKLRRWWKGVSIFQNSYILIPVHEELHWSLIIVCIPADDDLGPVVLHLDSLGLHCSRSIFGNIRRLLSEECKFLKLEDASGNGIHEKRIPVPQQTNDYDCGLFVLFFMERFMAEAPERLKKDDLAKFGKGWFRPEEASSLRVKIKRLLVEEFEKANSERKGTIPDAAAAAVNG